MALKVTFFLLAYNQERYIREAALAQDYPDLEVVLSDDCSTDGTFAIIQEPSQIQKSKSIRATTASCRFT